MTLFNNRELLRQVNMRCIDDRGLRGAHDRDGTEFSRWADDGSPFWEGAGSVSAMGQAYLNWNASEPNGGGNHHWHARVDDGVVERPQLRRCQTIGLRGTSGIAARQARQPGKPSPADEPPPEGTP
jgi:hypothetical protein